MSVAGDRERVDDTRNGSVAGNHNAQRGNLVLVNALTRRRLVLHVPIVLISYKNLYTVYCSQHLNESTVPGVSWSACLAPLLGGLGRRARGAIKEPEMGEPSITDGKNDTYIYGAALAMLRACSILIVSARLKNG